MTDFTTLNGRKDTQSVESAQSFLHTELIPPRPPLYKRMIDKGHKTNAHRYLGSCKTSMMEHFTKIVEIITAYQLRGYFRN